MSYHPMQFLTLHLMEIFPRLLENENTRNGTLDRKTMHFGLFLTNISFWDIASGKNSLVIYRAI